MPWQQLTTARAGLFTADAASVALAGVSVDAEISSFCARVVVAQRYVNRESHPIEAVYVFPLDEGAAVCGFEAIIDGTLVVGEIKEREDAFRMYDDAIEKGYGAFLLDEERPDVFQASVGSLPPGKEVLLKLTYVAELTVAGSGLRFSIPTTVSPRYAPAEDHRGVGRPDAQTLNPPVAWRVPYGLNLSVRLAMGGAITRIESPSHPASVTMNGRSATVTLSQRDVALDRDFVLSVECDGLDTPQAWIERDGNGGHAVALAFAPDLGQTMAPCDVTLLVDRSGSMEGTSIEEVRNALQLCLRSMNPGSTFNIVGFGSKYQSLFPESRAYDEASLAEASAHVRAMSANFGATEILPALQFVLEQPRQPGRPRQVVVLTDGEVTNTDAVIALARRHAAHSRIFTFGIGAGSSHHLVNGLARAGGGSAEFIYPGERIEPKVVRQFGRLLSPALTDVRVSWGGLDAKQAPASVPPIFAGGRLLLYAFVNEVATSVTPATVRLSATSPSGPVSFDVEFDPSRVVDGRTVATLAARARIRELEESPEWTSARGSHQRERKATSASREIVELSMRYGLMSRETSFVAVEVRETPVLGDMQLRRIPIALTSGWGGLEHDARRRPGRLLGRVHDGATDTGAFAAMTLLAGSRSPAGVDETTARLPLASARMTGSPVSGAIARGFDRLLAWGRGAGPSEPDHGSAKVMRADRNGVMVALVALQRADGSWDLTPEFAGAIGHDMAQLESALSGATGDRVETRRAWATALALAWLDEHARAAEGEWRLLAEKARRWLGGVTSRPADGGSWAEAGARLLTAKSG
jgi:Vault protein inter-alpha-trypsin domain/von Willebrand factor type A domain